MNGNECSRFRMGRSIDRAIICRLWMCRLLMHDTQQKNKPVFQITQTQQWVSECCVIIYIFLFILLLFCSAVRPIDRSIDRSFVWSFAPLFFLIAVIWHFDWCLEYSAWSICDYHSAPEFNYTIMWYGYDTWSILFVCFYSCIIWGIYTLFAFLHMNSVMCANFYSRTLGAWCAHAISSIHSNPKIKQQQHHWKSEKL